MQNSIENSAVIEKTRELCQTILEQPEFGAIRRQLDSFFSDSDVQDQYRALSEQGEALHQKQHQGLPLSPEEVMDFERQREAFFNNPVGKGFVDAQQALHRVQESVGQYVSKTLELGRIPTEADLKESCGSGCGCH